MGDKPAAFQPPSWAAAPACRAWLEVRSAGDAPDASPSETVRVDGKPWTTFGRAADAADVHVDDRRAAAAAAARATTHRNAARRLLEGLRDRMRRSSAPRRVRVAGLQRGSAPLHAVRNAC